MKTEKAICAELQELEKDSRLKQPCATTDENAPLALMQVDLEARIAILKWVLSIVLIFLFIGCSNPLSSSNQATVTGTFFPHGSINWGGYAELTCYQYSKKCEFENFKRGDYSADYSFNGIPTISEGKTAMISIYLLNGFGVESFSGSTMAVLTSGHNVINVSLP